MDQGAGRGSDGGSRRFFSEALSELIEYARHEAKLNQRDEKGIAKRAHFEVLANNSNPKVREQGLALLSGPELPEELDYLWQWFREISIGSGEGMTWDSIEAWSRLTDTEIAPHEVRAIFALDSVTRYPGEDN